MRCYFDSDGRGDGCKRLLVVSNDLFLYYNRESLQKRAREQGEIVEVILGILLIKQIITYHEK